MTPRPVSFGEEPRRRRPSLTPMVDVVFLLLIFFMLASRFGSDAVLAVSPAAVGKGTWQGPPRLVSIAADRLRLNGVEVEPSALAPALRPLMPDPDAPVILRAEPGASLQHVLSVAEALRTAGIATLVLAR